MDSREPDLTNIYFENTRFPLSEESLFQWLSESDPNGFFDANPAIEFSLDAAKCEPPRLFVVTKRAREGKKEPRMKMYIHDSICFQAPGVSRVGLGRLNNAGFFLGEAFAKLSEKKRRLEQEKQNEDDADKKPEGQPLVDVTLLRVLDEELFKP